MSLALAAHGLSQALEDVLGSVHVVVDTPSATAEMTKSNMNEDFLNIFLYRVAPSAVHASQAANEPFFLRVFALLTPFARREVAGGGNNNGNNNGASGPADYPDLQILTDVIRHFHENPVSEIMHAQDGGTGTAYRIHAIPQAPEMEELNHIWTTQNSTLGYRLSAVFEFSLVPVDPSEIATPAPPVRAAMAQVSPDMARRDETPTGYATEFRSFPGLPAQESDLWDGPANLPQLLIVADSGLLGEAEIAANATSIPLRLAGPTAFEAVITTSHRDADGQELGSQTARRPIVTVSLADDSGNFTHPLALPAGTRAVVISVRAGKPGGADLSLDRVANTITLTVPEAP